MAQHLFGRCCTCHVEKDSDKWFGWVGGRAGSRFTSSCLVSLCMAANTGRLQPRLAVSQKLSSGSTNSLSLCSTCISCNHSVKVLHILSLGLNNMEHGSFRLFILICFFSEYLPTLLDVLPLNLTLHMKRKCAPEI